MQPSGALAVRRNVRAQAICLNQNTSNFASPRTTPSAACSRGDDRERSAARDTGRRPHRFPGNRSCGCLVPRGRQGIHVQSGQAADVLGENGILASKVRVQPVGPRELADEVFSRSKSWVFGLETGIPDVLVKDPAQAADDHAADLSPRPVQVSLGVISPEEIMILVGIDVVVAWNPTDTDTCIEQGLQLLPEGHVEVTVSQDHDPVRPLGGAGFEQGRPVTVGVAVDDQAAHGGIRFPLGGSHGGCVPQIRRVAPSQSARSFATSDSQSPFQSVP